MILLSADTSSAKFSIALSREGMLVDEFEAESLNSHSSSLLHEIEKLLSKNSYDISDIEGFCIGLGPGSFTGLRIGITTMRGLAFTLKKPIAGIPSIDSLSLNLAGHKGRICPIIDAKQNKVYSRIYNCNGKKIEAKGTFLLLSIDDLLKKVKGPTTFLGDGVGLYRDYISGKMGSDAEFSPESTWYPKAAIIGRLGYDRLKAHKGDNIFSLSPLYIYPKECQIRKSSKNKARN